MVRPFLKWAGGKRQLLPQLRKFVPPQFNGYFEPFVGSGALFFDLAAAGRIGDRLARLTDINRDLLGTYCAIARESQSVIDALVEHDREHRRAPRDHFYRVRDQLFNPWRTPLFGKDGHRVEEYPADLAAMFIYLNRTAFNGLFRLNSRGEFNVPAGRYTDPRICDSDNLRAVSKVLGQPSVTVAYDSFEQVLDQARPGDLLYFDPPYAPLSQTANFTGYTAAGFNDHHQRQLQYVAIELAKRGCYIIVSNSTAPIIRALYDNDQAARDAGLRAHRVKARRAINSNASKRGDVAEYIISNVTASR
jgi:DNA adenine methylase